MLPFIARFRLALLFQALLVLLLSLVMVHVIFLAFPLVFSMASNADSLVLFDFARDLIQGKALQLWNLPRAPYLFPDTILATALISLGWYGIYSVYAIACINYLLMVFVVHAVIVHSTPYRSLRVWQTSVCVSAALLIIGLAFPFAMVNIYWQLFASGAHFLTALVVLCILMLLNRWQSTPSVGLWLLIFSVTVLEALSDSMAALLLFAWIGQQVISRFFLSKRLDQGAVGGTSGFSVGIFLRQCIDLVTVFLAVVIGTLLGALLPRQSLLESFFSFDKFVTAAKLFVLWTIDSPSHGIFILLVIAGTFLYPLLLLAPQPQLRLPLLARASKIALWLGSPVVLPSIALMLSTPLFYQELGSLRYLIFPALLLLICVCALFIQLAHLVKCSSVWTGTLIISISLFLVAALVYVDIKGGLIGKQQITSGRDAVGLAVGADASGALACIEQAKERYPLADGVATYWNARPIRFASQFEFYLAQINPWRPRAGYFLWGNNGVDFVYRDVNSGINRDIKLILNSSTANTSAAVASPPPPVRSYNFVIATQAEQQSRLWGSLPMQATHTVQCKNHALYYFADPAILWQYLFPLGLPVPTVPAALGAPNAEHAEVKVGSSAVVSYWPDDLFTQVGAQSSAAISSTGKSGFLVYGPYLSLPAGQYRLQVLGDFNTKAQASADEPKESKESKESKSNKPTPIGFLDVSTQFGAKIITSMPLQAGSTQIAQLDFQLQQDTHDVEFRIQVNADVQGQLTGYRLERLAN